MFFSLLDTKKQRFDLLGDVNNVATFEADAK